MVGQAIYFKFPVNSQVRFNSYCSAPLVCLRMRRLKAETHYQLINRSAAFGTSFCGNSFRPLNGGQIATHGTKSSRRYPTFGPSIDNTMVSAKHACAAHTPGQADWPLLAVYALYWQEAVHGCSADVAADAFPIPKIKITRFRLAAHVSD